MSDVETESPVAVPDTQVAVPDTQVAVPKKSSTISSVAPKNAILSNLSSKFSSMFSRSSPKNDSNNQGVLGTFISDLNHLKNPFVSKDNPTIENTPRTEESQNIMETSPATVEGAVSFVPATVEGEVSVPATVEGEESVVPTTTIKEKESVVPTTTVEGAKEEIIEKKQKRGWVHAITKAVNEGINVYKEHKELIDGFLQKLPQDSSASGANRSNVSSKIGKFTILFRFNDTIISYIDANILTIKDILTNPTSTIKFNNKNYNLIDLQLPPPSLLETQVEIGGYTEYQDAEIFKKKLNFKNPNPDLTDITKIEMAINIDPKDFDENIIATWVLSTSSGGSRKTRNQKKSKTRKTKHHKPKPTKKNTIRKQFKCKYNKKTIKIDVIITLPST